MTYRPWLATEHRRVNEPGSLLSGAPDVLPKKSANKRGNLGYSNQKLYLLWFVQAITRVLNLVEALLKTINYKR